MSKRANSFSAARWSVALSVTLLLSATGHEENEGERTTSQIAAQAATALAADQIYNEGGSSPTVAFSVVEGGLSAGTVDGDGNLDEAPDFVDAVGTDKFAGTLDDDLSLGLNSPSIDGGLNAALPADRCDLDADGDTNEPFPVDIGGSARIIDGGSGASVVDIGAFEFDPSDPVGIEPEGNVAGSYRLEAPFPNPASESATVRFQVRALARTSLAVYDLLGRQVMSLFDARTAPGKEYEVQVPVSRFPSGVYILQLSSGRHKSSTELVVAR